VLAVSYRWEVIRDHFGDAYRGLPLAYSVEDEPLGTGGAIRQALDLAGQEEIAVFNGDTLFPVDFVAMGSAHRTAGAILTMALKHVDDCGRFGRVEVSPDGIITGFQEKGGDGAGWINGGIYLLDRRLFADYPMPSRFSFEQDLVEPHIGDIRPAAFISDASFIDMGIPDDYRRLQDRIGN
jgi:NDP-sugar pyrophosphorylase family protein